MVAIVDTRRASRLARRFGLSAAVQVWRKRALFAAVTPSRLWNLAVRTTAFCLHDPGLGGLPVHLKVDVAPLCQLRCPVCFHGERTPRERTPGLMSIEAYRALVEEVHASTFALSLYNLGEPLLHPRITEMVEIASRRRLATYMTTNLSLALKPGHLQAVTTAGLSMLLVAVDGITRETFGRERKGGRWDLVEANLAELARLKRAGARTRVVLQFIAFDFNTQEIERLRAFAERYALDEVHIIEGATEPWVHVNRPSASPRLKTRALLPHCPWPFFSAVVLSGGEVNACCHYRMREPYTHQGSTQALGRLTDQPLREVYAGARARTARRMASDPRRAAAGEGGFCSGCRVLVDERPAPAPVGVVESEALTVVQAPKASLA